MTSNRWTRWLAPLALAMIVGTTPAPVRAQEPAPPTEGGESSGRPLDGYLATACLAFFALFVVGKSARR